MKVVKIGKTNEVAPGKMKEYQIEGRPIAVANYSGKLYAFDGLCTHAQCPLAGGSLEDKTVTCYCHGAQFDITSGQVLAPPATSSLQTYEVEIRGEDLYIKLS